MEELLVQLGEAVLAGDEQACAALAAAAIQAGHSGRTIMDDVIQPALATLGSQFEAGEAFLPDLILGGDAAKAALAVIMPYLTAETGGAGRGKIVIGTSKGDLHDIGKNIVGALLTANGWEVVDLGVDVPANKFLEAAVREGAQIIAMSSLLTTSLPYQTELVSLLVDSGRRDRFFVIIGGGPVTPQWAGQIGADGYGREAHDAVTLCKQLLAGPERPPLAAPICVGALR
jgi:5-methyltetrahydrofolate--homocysteine methyltransferase